MKRFVLGIVLSAAIALPAFVLADTGTETWTETTSAKEEAPAQDLSNQELLTQVSELTKRVQELETKLAEKAAPVAGSDRLKLLEDRLTAQEKITSTGGPGFSLDSLPAGNFLKKTKISGFVDTSYTFNFNQPDGLSNNSNGGLAAANLHPFDRGSNDFTLQLVEVVLEQDAAPLGYRVDLDFGDDAEVFGAAGLGRTDDEFDVEQAYLVYKIPVEKWVDFFSGSSEALGLPHKLFEGWSANIMGGKYVTMAGAEVIEAKDNWNFSRSFLFALAIPFTHTGVRTNWNYNGWLDFSTGVNNGWDLVDDNNQAKSLEFRLGATPSPWGIDWVTGSVLYLFGAEQANKDGDHRHLIDLVATVKNPFKEIEWLNKLTLMFNMDWAMEQWAQRFDEGGIGSISNADPAALNANPALFGDSHVRWHGYAAYAKYELFPWWYIASRLEWFQDTDGARTLRQQDLWEYTLTNQFNLFENLITRIEYRHDGADKPIFGWTNTGGVNRFRSWQDILYLEAVVTF